jgi:hypothetical protein
MDIFYTAEDSEARVVEIPILGWSAAKRVCASLASHARHILHTKDSCGKEKKRVSEDPIPIFR